MNVANTSELQAQTGDPQSYIEEAAKLINEAKNLRAVCLGGGYF